MKQSSEVRVGLVGTGRMAAAMAAAISHVPGVRVVGVASGSADRARNFAAAFCIPAACEGLPELIGRGDIDLVYIANATKAHADTAVAALQAGTAVLCEKPSGVSEAECQRIAEAARQTGCLFMEAIWTPFLPAYRRALELARSGAIGAPVQLYADFGYPVTRQTYPTLFEAAGGGALLDRGVYPIALALKLFGPVETVEASTIAAPDGVDLHVSLQIVHKSGGQSQLATSLVTLMSNTAVIACTCGSITLEPPVVGAEQLTIRRMVPGAGAPAATHPRSFESRLMDQLRANPMLRRLRRRVLDGAREHHPYGASQYIPLLEHVFDLVRSGKRESEMVPLEFSLDVLRVIDQARAAGSQSIVKDGCQP